jgi:histone H3
MARTTHRAFPKRRFRPDEVHGKARKRPTALTPVKMRRARRFHPGTVALREIRRLQKSTTLLLRKLPFSRIVREICQDIKVDTRIKRATFAALQEATEAYMIAEFERAHLIAIHSKRVSLQAKDLDCMRAVRV